MASKSTDLNNDQLSSPEQQADDTKLAELKKKKYKLSGEAINDEAAHMNVNKNEYDANVNNLKHDYSKDIELKNLNTSNSKSETDVINANGDSNKQNKHNHNNNTTSLSSSRDNPNSKTKSAKKPKDKNNNLLYKLDNLIDFNSKFDSHLLEKKYVKSYLPVTRLFFIKYLIYLLVFSICWIIYFCIENEHLSSKLSGTINKNSFSKNTSNQEANSNDNFFTLNDNSYNQTLDLNISSYLINQISTSKLTNSNSRLFSIVYLFVITFVFLATFVFLLIAEIKETRYRNLEKKLNRQQLEAKVDIKKAERDLKEAMEDVIQKEKFYAELNQKLESKYANLDKLRNIHSKLFYLISMFIVVCMFLLCFISFVYPPPSLTQLTHFIWFCESTLLLYMIYPFQMGISVFFGVLFSILFEIFAIRSQINYTEFDKSSTPNVADEQSFKDVYRQSQMIIFLFIKFLLHSSLHLIGSYLKISLQGVKRDTFLKVAHIHKAQMTAKQDKDITERMIKSIMPPLFTHIFGKPEEFKESVNKVNKMRPLYIYPVNEISILFADIVGFTKMSSTKTAEELVFLLNDLYGRFDKLCEQAGCEKISTLGDCYYCVSGCLNGRQDHAICCVEMGLLMVKEIELFNKAHNVDVNMRVGVHTGNALCGFIGGKRFRFDVWSGDVTLANKMESSGRAGWVHISEDTQKHLQNKFNLEVGEKYSGKPTYFVIRETKRETVAEALKLNANMNTNLDSSSSNNLNASTNLNESKKSASSESECLNKTSEELIAQYDQTEPTNRSEANLNVLLDEDEDRLLLQAVKNTHFYQPDVNLLTLRFDDGDEEKKFQGYLMGLDKKAKKINLSHGQFNLHFKNPKSIWTNTNNTLFLSILVSFIINLCVSTAYFLTFIVSSMTSYNYKQTSSYKLNLIAIIVLFLVINVIQGVFLVIYFIQYSIFSSLFLNKSSHNASEENLASESSNRRPQMKNINDRIHNRAITIRFIIVHLISTILLSLMPIFILTTGLPIVCNIIESTWSTLVSPNYTLYSELLNNENRMNLFGMYSYFCYIVAIIHFCSFFQLSSLFKTTLALVFALIFGIVSFSGVYKNFSQTETGQILSKVESVFMNKTLSNEPNQTYNIINELYLNEYSMSSQKLTFNFYTTLFIQGFLKENCVILIDLGLLVFLIWIVNCQSELIQRLSFKCDQDTHLKVTYAREQKELANWLIEVVLPSYVVNNVKEKKQYSRNHECVGVLFVSLCNFWEFFEESYEGGRELLRVLNEITVDFDRLFDEPKYKSIEKIKSIGSTFMIASGLSPDENDKDKNQRSHLYDLIDFALELNEKLEAFNNEAMSVCHFKFQMRLGFNCGPVTSGVIGTERLLYDIWGDTVNVASRMDSTGQAGFMQTPKEVATMLQNDYKFFERGPIQIKGKDQMITYFLNPKENKKINLNS